MPSDIRDIINEVYMRTMRSRPSGDTSSQRVISQQPSNLQLDDEARGLDKSNPVSNGLLVWWSLDDTAVNGTDFEDWIGTVTDLSHVGLGGVDTTSTEGKILEGRLFGGDSILRTTHSSGEFVASGLDDLFDGGATLELWFRQDSSGDVDLFNKNLQGFFDWSIQIKSDLSLEFVHTFSTTSGVWSTAANTISTSVEHHLVIVYTADSVSNVPIIYVDNESVVVTTDTTPVGTTNEGHAQMYLGGSQTTVPSRANMLSGMIDEVRVYGRPLTPTEVAHNFKLHHRAVFGTFLPSEEVAV